MKAIYEVRPDLRAAFPQAEGKDRSAVIDWALTHGLREMRVDAAFEPKLRSALTNAGHVTSPLGRGGPVTEGFGVNLLGFLQSEKGMGEHCRATIRSLKAAGIPHALNNWVDPSSANLDADCSAFRTDNPYPINLIHLNAIDAPFLYKEIPAYFHGRYNVGYWNWELDWFPEEWRGSFQFFDEIWAPSTFSQKSNSRLSPIPVHWMPMSIAIPPSSSPTVSREQLSNCRARPLRVLVRLRLPQLFRPQESVGRDRGVPPGLPAAARRGAGGTSCAIGRACPWSFRKC